MKRGAIKLVFPWEDNRCSRQLRGEGEEQDPDRLDRGQDQPGEEVHQQVHRHRHHIRRQPEGHHPWHLRVTAKGNNQSTRNERDEKNN